MKAKKILAAVLAGALALCATACSGGGNQENREPCGF